MPFIAPPDPTRYEVENPDSNKWLDGLVTPFSERKSGMVEGVGALNAYGQMPVPVAPGPRGRTETKVLEKPLERDNGVPNLPDGGGMQNASDVSVEPAADDTPRAPEPVSTVNGGGVSSIAPLNETEEVGGTIFRQTPVTDEDIALARKAGHGYGSGHELFFEDQPGKNFSGDNYLAAYLVAGKSAVLSLGFDPRLHKIDEDKLDELSDSSGRLSGAYLHPISKEAEESLTKMGIKGITARDEQVLTRGDEEIGWFNPTTLAHEFGHRGLVTLRKAYPDAPELRVVQGTDNEEAVVRYLHHQAAGTEPTAWELKRWPEMDDAYFQHEVARLEKFAADHIAKRGTVGPR